MKHQGRDPKQALVEQELMSWFENEVVDEELLGYRLTRVDLSSDRAHITLWYLPPEGPSEQRDVPEMTWVKEALAGHRREAQTLVEGILQKHADVRWREDKGAENRRRVDSILEDLREEQGKDG